jgi:hypothetical protein
MGIMRAVVRQAEAAVARARGGQHTAHLPAMIALVRQVLAQTRARLLRGNTHYPGKAMSLFEPHTEIIRKGKLAKPTQLLDNRCNGWKRCRNEHTNCKVSTPNAECEEAPRTPARDAQCRPRRKEQRRVQDAVGERPVAKEGTRSHGSTELWACSVVYCHAISL